MKKLINRRNALKSVVKLGVTTIAGTNLIGSSIAAVPKLCSLTAEQPEGPFYPISEQFDTDNDLTLLKNSTRRAKGEIVILKGVVSNQNCTPIKGALVEIWQACDSGKYDHPGDPNTASLDPNFQYWGKAVTNHKGEYSFKTIKPGRYRASSTWERPPHIHLKTHLRGHIELTTQVYFEEEYKLNHEDRILQNLSASERKDVICKFKKSTASSNYREGHFNITLKSLS